MLLLEEIRIIKKVFFTSVIITLLLIISIMLVACNGNADEPDPNEPTLYTITFECNGGSKISPISMQAGAEITPPPPPVREGFTFAGWRNENSNFAPYFTFGLMPERNIILYADWDALFYTVTFVIGEGAERQSGSLVQTIPYAGSAVPPLCKRVGYELTGWQGEYTSITKNTTITAIWEVISCTVVFDPNCDDAILVSGQALQTVEYGTSINPPLYARDGYKFTHWELSKTGARLDNVVMDFTAIAQWEEKLTVAFSGNGGVLTSGNELQLVEKGRAASPPTYEKYGYDFDGWTLVPSGGNLNDVQCNISATAKWKIKTYNVSFSPGHADAEKISGQEQHIIEHGTTVTPPEYQAEDYVFIGWSLSPNDADLQNVQCNIVATAIWEQGYLVIFYPNDGILISGDLEQIVKSGHNAAPPILEKEGYGYTWDKAYENITAAITINAVWYTSGLSFLQVSDGYEVKGTQALNAQEVIIPSIFNALPVVGIADNAFENKSFTDINIGDNIKYIGKEAFLGCTGITTIVISYGSQVNILEESVFSGCKNLQYISLPYAIYNIKRYAFQNCTSLISVTIPNVDSIEFGSIDDSAFVGCESLQTFIIPANIQQNGLGKGVFSGCIALNEITIPSQITNIPDNTFVRCANLESAVMGSVTIGKNAFNSCVKLTEILADAIFSIGESAFSGCINLEGIDISKAESINIYAFKDCKKIDAVTLSEDLTVINEAVFYGCSDLSKIIISKNVVTIDKNAFYNCSSLTAIFYQGDSVGWQDVAMGENAINTGNVSIYYYSEDAIYDGEHWHYDTNNAPEIWEQ